MVLGPGFAQLYLGDNFSDRGEVWFECFDEGGVSDDDLFNAGLDFLQQIDYVLLGCSHSVGPRSYG